ncbi:transcriptional antiterminator, BglG [Coriobacterium glomerans PW2]|uniref:Transcriptional antiterminator, BglG n=1 Tax=Coriobacterium glomerans (strain ATCC 49209 / DSM 20642 / JCM 10262 / PW2) TaxID=700015 RepID=F2NAV5_CORGP|nr:PTS sugar transporter subunit IIA [Coriobacterium glomerans]AEB07633.1 transcriptional antiterminator, BglG [Coriobacterium glomerans PW2]
MNSLDYRLLRYLLINGTTKLSVLAESENVSCRTMRKYILNLSRALGTAAEVKINSNGYYLHILNRRLFCLIQSGALKHNIDNNDRQKRQAEILFMLIQEGGFISIDDLADQLIVSRGTLQKDLDSCQVWLHGYDIAIQGVTSRGIRLRIGSAADLVVFVYYKMLDYIQNRLPTDEGLINQVVDLLTSLNVSKTITRTFVNITRILVFLKRNGYEITEVNVVYTNLVDDSDHLSKLMEIIEDQCQVVFNPMERLFLTFPFNLYSNPLLSNEKTSSALDRNKVLFDEVSQSLNALINTRIDYDQFYDSIKYHLIFLINRAVFHVAPSDFLRDQMLEKFQLAADLAASFSKALEDRLDLEISDVEINYLTIYFEMALQKSNNVGSDQPRVGFLLDMGLSALNYLQNQLNIMFESNVVLSAYQNEAEIIQDQNDLIMVFSDRILDCGLKIPVVMVGDIFRDRILETKVKASALQHEIDAGRVIWRSQPFDNRRRLGYEEVLRRVLRPDGKAGTVDTEFCQRLIDNEASSKLILANGVAIPHAIGKIRGNNLFLSLVILTEPILVRRSEVRYIFIIGIPSVLEKKTLEDLSMLYDLLFLIAVNEEAVANLKRTATALKPLTIVTEGL